VAGRPRIRVAWAALAALALVTPAAHAGAPDLPGRTPAAVPGTPAATKRALSRDELARELRQQLRQAGGASGAWVADVDAPRGERLLFADSDRRPLVLASNQKLFTTAAILARFGPDRRFSTGVYVRGEVRGGVLDGNLVLLGAGDPAFGSRSFAARRGLPLTPVRPLARAVDRAGIERVTGRVRADDTIFDRRRGVGATDWGPDPYLSPLSGLSFNSGFAEDGSYAERPELVAARHLHEALKKLGVEVRRGIGRADLGAALLDRIEPLREVRSPELRTLIAATNKPSNNFFAEMLLKRLVATRGDPGSTTDGARALERFADRMGSGLEARDGSGLSYNDRATPRQVGRLLVAMARREREAGAFRHSLPVAGEEGTLADRMEGTAAEGVCRAKTGTLTGITTLSGYCRADGHLVAFAILMNDVDVYGARAAQDRMASAIARYEP
jgi:serine-type D-Ala-D-Ala carboxypeptidase/endopeptidase (penicillin-binding protein 4)